jgi:serine/threonine protein kinase
MDFGLSKRYLSSNGEHIDLREDRTLMGTARYASINVHMGFEPSRRDDLESVGYMLVYFIKKKLPWQGLKKKKDVDQLKLIGEYKMKISLDELCDKLPQCFKEYLKYCRNLKFSETPDYKYLKRLFLDTAIKLDLTPELYWISN